MMVGQVSNLGAMGTIGQPDKMETAALSLTHPGPPYFLAKSGPNPASQV
jgi:hypothetical protein